jgi:hypothetical protein
VTSFIADNFSQSMASGGLVFGYLSPVVVLIGGAAISFLCISFAIAMISGSSAGSSVSSRHGGSLSSPGGAGGMGGSAGASSRSGRASRAGKRLGVRGWLRAKWTNAHNEKAGVRSVPGSRRTLQDVQDEFTKELGDKRKVKAPMDNPNSTPNDHLSAPVSRHRPGAGGRDALGHSPEYYAARASRKSSGRD